MGLACSSFFFLAFLFCFVFFCSRIDYTKKKAGQANDSLGPPVLIFPSFLLLHLSGRQARTHCNLLLRLSFFRVLRCVKRS